MTAKANQVSCGSQYKLSFSLLLILEVQLRDVWASDIEKSDYKGRTDVVLGLSSMTLDVIGQAGKI